MLAMLNRPMGMLPEYVVTATLKPATAGLQIPYLCRAVDVASGCDELGGMHTTASSCNSYMANAYIRAKQSAICSEAFGRLICGLFSGLLHQKSMPSACRVV